jgi:DnaK suppressor protein
MWFMPMWPVWPSATRAETSAEPAPSLASEPVAVQSAAIEVASVPTPRRPVVKVPAKTSASKDAQRAQVADKPAAPAPAKVAARPAPEKLKAGTEVKMPTVNKRATQAAMQAQMGQVVELSHDPRAAKATFSNAPEREISMTFTSPVQKDPKRVNNWKNQPLEALSDADVLAMPDDEYMNDVQLAYFRRKLQQLKSDILVNAGETTEHLREETVVVPDPADRATIEEEHALELRTRDRERKLLKKIEQSIARIDSGDYGYCDETGEPIGVGRLLARPTASLSIEAQQRRELKQKLFGD